MMNGFLPFGGFFMIIFWILIIIGIYFLVVSFSPKDNNNTKNKSSPLDILKERYAKGEVDKKEFEEKKKDLLY